MKLPPAGPIIEATKKTLKTLLVLSKVVIPVVFLMAILSEFELLQPIAGRFGPFMRLLGLPGEAALPVLLGFFVNIYAAVSSIGSLSLSSREVTVVALIILTSHSLLMESPVLKTTGFSPWQSILFRMASAFFFGFALNAAYLLVGA